MTKPDWNQIDTSHEDLSGAHAQEAAGVVTWGGTKPDECQLCHAPIDKVFIDGRMAGGPWALMCPTCHSAQGVGLGTGRGQRYILMADGRFHKTAG